MSKFDYNKDSGVAKEQTDSKLARHAYAYDEEESYAPIGVLSKTIGAEIIPIPGLDTSNPKTVTCLAKYSKIVVISFCFGLDLEDNGTLSKFRNLGFKGDLHVSDMSLELLNSGFNSKIGRFPPDKFNEFRDLFKKERRLIFGNPKTNTHKKQRGFIRERFKMHREFVNNSLKDLTPLQIKIWFVLWDRFSVKTGTAQISIKEFQKLCNASRPHVVKQLSELQSLGLIAVMNKGGPGKGSNAYAISPVCRKEH